MQLNFKEMLFLPNSKSIWPALMASKCNNEWKGFKKLTFV